MKSTYTLLICFISFFSFGQNLDVKNLDNQIKHLNKEDSLIILGFKQKFAQHINPNPDSSLYYIHKIRKFSIEKNYLIGITEADYAYANYFRRIQKFDSAVVSFKKSSELSKKINYTKGNALAQNGLCRTYYFLGQLNNASNACKECLSDAKSVGDLALITDTYTAFGNLYSRQNDLKEAVNYFLKADSLHSITPQRPDIIAAAYQSLGTIYKDLKDYNKSEHYFIKSNEEFSKLPMDVTFYLNTTNIHLGSVYYHKNNLVKADSLLTKMYDYFKKINEGSSVAQISTYLGLIKLKQKNFSDAEKYLKEGFVLNEEKKYSYETAMAALELGKLFITKKEPKKAIFYLDKILSNYNDEANKSVKYEAMLKLSKANALEKKYDKAYALIEEAMKIKDSLNSIQNRAKITEIEAIYQTEKKEQQIALLKSEKELTAQKQKSQRNLLIGGLGITTIAGIFLFVLFRNRQKTNAKLKELDTVKSKFFANISHEFRTPLTLISNPIDEALEDPSITDKKRDKFIMAKRNSDRLLSLVNQLLDLSKIDAGQLKLHIQKGNITQLISALSDSFSYLAKQKQIQYIVDVKHSDIGAYYDKDAIEKIVINLLSNAIKYTPEHGNVNCSANINNDKLIIEVKNTGQGLKKEELKQVFQRFYQTSEENNGTGIGLALVKELVELHKGSISVDSELNTWTTFKVILPVDKQSFKSEQFVDTCTESINVIANTPLKAIVIDEDINDVEDSELPILLIVEDNADLRSLLEHTFDNDYKVITANDGEKGIDLAIEHIPDIIISDIMMPIKNGIELTETLKNDERTSHIPIVLLTAKAGDANELKGIEVGADDYITKPFNSQILITKVSKLIETRQLLQNRYSQELILTPKDIAITKLDEEFLEKVQVVLNVNLVEASFSIEDFSKAVGMSRMQLHRKIKALTGLSASEFIRSQRLKLAAQLLKKSDINISEVGYSVGFNDPSYFTKCFKVAYNCTPTEFAKRK